MIMIIMMTKPRDMWGSRAPVCPVFKVMDEELLRALADG
jgi:hypothetical protein